MFSYRYHRQRFVIPLLFTTLTLILTLTSGCSDDCPTCPDTPCFDIGGLARNTDGSPASGIPVFLGRDPDFRPMAGTFVFDSVMTDNEGRYEFNRLDRGTYRTYAGVWDQGGGGLSQVSPFSGPLAIVDKAAGHVANLTLRVMANEGVVVGEVFYQDGQVLVPADSATVSLLRYEGAAIVPVAETFTDGAQFALTGVLTGNYMVRAAKIMETDAPFPFYLSAESKAFFCDGEDLARVERLVLEDVMVEKPAVYIYPEQAGRFQVGLGFGHGVRLTASEPDYGSGWDVFVAESGRIDSAWDYLFYEIAMIGPPLIAEGWCLSWSELSAGLESITLAAGLTAGERDDFLTYWMTRLPRRDYYEIHPVFGSDLNAWVELEVVPAPDAVLRFWLFFRGRDSAVEMPAPQVPAVERRGTTVVEWGGAVIP